MNPRIFLAFVAPIFVMLYGSLIGCSDDSKTSARGSDSQAKSTYATLSNPVSLTSDETDLLAQCHGRYEFLENKFPPEKDFRILHDAYRKAAVHVPTDHRQDYDRKVGAIHVKLTELLIALGGTGISDAERQRFEYELYGPKHQDLIKQCSGLLRTRFPSVEGELMAKAKAEGVAL